MSLTNFALAAPHDFVPLAARRSRRAHLVGIGGSGMRSLADVLDAGGWQISGSDSNGEALVGSRFKVRHGHRADAVTPGVDLVVYSDAVPQANPELGRARDLGVATYSYPQMLGRLMESRLGVAVAGTHGKSTTTAMAAEIMAAAGLDPTVVCGAAPIGKDSGGHLGRGRWMVAEACEYRANFRHLEPRIAAILGIEADHFDCFAAPAELEEAFARFARAVPADGLIIARDDCAATRRAIRDIRCTSESFGVAATATWRASELGERRGLYSMSIRCRQRLVCDVKLRVPGRHNVSNALAAAALASHCGATGSAIRTGLERFAGLHRRLELVGEHNDIAILDDYAHHPTEVAAALAAVRQMYPARRVWCVFQPHQASRTRHLLDEFAHSLQNADKVVIAEIFRAREQGVRVGEIGAAALAARAAALGADVVELARAAEIRDHLKQSLRSGDVLVTMGAGDIGNVAYELDHGIRTFRKAG